MTDCGVSRSPTRTGTSLPSLLSATRKGVSRSASRRDFLAASAIAMVGLARGLLRRPFGGGVPLDESLLYVGTYTDDHRSDGIYLLRMDRRSGRLRSIGSVNAGPNPSFLAIHPNGRSVYAVNEIAQGAVRACAIARDS